eukprot:341444-Chlamydomonas_euryale.AAC.3
MDPHICLYARAQPMRRWKGLSLERDGAGLGKERGGFGRERGGYGKEMCGCGTARGSLGCGARLEPACCRQV